MCIEYRPWPHRLAVRTSDSHSGDTGSIPVGAAKFHKRCVYGDAMKIRKLLSNIICGFIPGKSRRDMVRVKLRYNTRGYVKFVRDYFNEPKLPVKTCVGFGCCNFIVIVGGRYAFKFPLLDDGAERALRELRITTALRKYTTFRIPEMEIIKWNNIAVRKYEFFPGVTLNEIPPRIAMANRHHIARQIATFMYQVGAADPVAIRDLKPKKTDKPGFMYGWFHNDIGANFILNPETLDIVGFIDWETVAFCSFQLGLYAADHFWDKYGYRGMAVDVMTEYAKLYYSNK